MKYKFPVRANKIIVSQPFRSTTPVDLSKALSKEKEHNGLDIVCGTNEETWGKECIWSFPWTGIVYDAQVDSQFGATQHAHCQIDTVDPVTGIKYSVVYLHLSSVTESKSPEEDKFISYNQGDVIGRIGNNGYCVPAPTPARPYDGTHLHLGLGVKKPSDTNYIMTDPQLYFDVNDPYLSTPPSSDPLPSAILEELGNKMTDPIQAKLVLLVAKILKAFNS